MSSQFSLERRRSLRLSTRKRKPALSSDLDDCFNGFRASSPKKPRIRRSFIKLPSLGLVKVPSRNLLQLPLSVLEHLLLFLDVSNLELLSTTCSFFHQLISGLHITSLDFPFSTQFLTELSQSPNIEKKPLLSLRSTKTDDTNVPDDEDVFVEYMVASQLALLSLAWLRELHLVPRNLEAADPATRPTNTRINNFVEFDRIMLKQLAGLGGLANITRCSARQFPSSRPTGTPPPPEMYKSPE